MSGYVREDILLFLIHQFFRLKEPGGKEFIFFKDEIREEYLRPRHSTKRSL